MYIVNSWTREGIVLTVHEHKAVHSHLPLRCVSHLQIKSLAKHALMMEILLIHAILANYIRSQSGMFIGEGLEPTATSPLSLFFKPLKSPVSPFSQVDKGIPGVLVTRDLRVIEVARDGGLVLAKLRPSSSRRMRSAVITADSLDEIKIGQQENVRFHKQTIPNTEFTRFLHGEKCIAWGRFGLRLGNCSSQESFLRFPHEQKSATEIKATIRSLLGALGPEERQAMFRSNRKDTSESSTTGNDQTRRTKVVRRSDNNEERHPKKNRITEVSDTASPQSSDDVPETSEDDAILDILAEILTSTSEQTFPQRIPVPMRSVQPIAPMRPLLEPGRYHYPNQSPFLTIRGQPYVVVHSAQGNRIIPSSPSLGHQNGAHAHGDGLLYQGSSNTEMSLMIKALLLTKVLNEKNPRTTQEKTLPWMLALMLFNEEEDPMHGERTPMANLIMALLMSRDYDSRIAKSDEEIRSMARREAMLVALEKDVEGLKEYRAIDKEASKKDKVLEDKLRKEIESQKGGGLFGSLGGLAKLTPQGQALSAIGG